MRSSRDSNRGIGRAELANASNQVVTDAIGVPESTPVVDVSGLRVTFPSEEGGRVEAVRGVDIELHRGEVLAFVGESGSGKSVTAMSLIQLPPAGANVTADRLHVAGVDMLTAKDATIRRVRGAEVGVVFQDPMTALNPVRKIGVLFREYLKRNGVQEKEVALARALAALRSVGVPAPEERLSLYAHQLSGGLRQRVLIAMALSLQPKLIIADEPTTALDATVKIQVLDVLRDVAAGRSMVFITHDIAAAKRVADRIAVFYAGEIVESGPTDVLIENPSHPYTKALLEAVPRLDGTGPLPGIPGSPPVRADSIGGCAFRLRCPKADGVCEMENPPLLPIAENRQVACHHPVTR